MKNYTITTALALYISVPIMADNKTYHITSPDKQIQVEIKIGKEITYSLKDKDIVLMQDNRIGFNISGKEI